MIGLQVRHVFSTRVQLTEPVLLQYGTNKGASQVGMTPYGAGRQIRLEGELTSFDVH